MAQTAKQILAENAGAIYSVRNQRIKFVVTVYDGELANMDTDSGRWQTVCEEHGSICSHSARALAVSFAAVPWEWCEDCRWTMGSKVQAI